MNSNTKKHAVGIKITFLLLPMTTFFLLMINILKPEYLNQWAAPYNIMVLFGLSEVLIIATAVTSGNSSVVKVCATFATLLLLMSITLNTIASLVLTMSVTVVSLIYKQVYGKIHQGHCLNAKLVNLVLVGLLTLAIIGQLLFCITGAGYGFIISLCSLLATIYAIGGITILLNKIIQPNSIKSLIED